MMRASTEPDVHRAATEDPRTSGQPPAWHVLATRNPYHDLGGDYFLNRDNPDDRRRRAIAQLERLGYQVTLEPQAA